MSVPRDANRIPMPGIDDFQREDATPAAFTGGTANTRGNDGGTLDPFTLYTVTGDVRIRIFGVCDTVLAGASATLEVGIVGNTAGLIAQTTGTDIDAGELWHDATPDAGIELFSVAIDRLLVAGADIIETTATADVTSGQIHYVCYWSSASEDGNVVAANNA